MLQLFRFQHIFHKIFLSVIVVSVLASLACNNFDMHQQANSQTRQIPDQPQLNPELKYLLNQRAASSGIEEFSGIPLKNDDIDVRVWAKGGHVELRGIVFKRQTAKWSVFYLPPMSEADSNEHLVDLTQKLEDWSSFMQRLSDHRLLFGVKQSEIEMQTRFNDGQSVIIEFNLGADQIGGYNIVEPCAQEFDVAARVCAALKDIQRELGVKLILLPAS